MLLVQLHPQILLRIWKRAADLIFLSSPLSPFHDQEKIPKAISEKMSLFYFSWTKRWSNTLPCSYFLLVQSIALAFTETKTRRQHSSFCFYIRTSIVLSVSSLIGFVHREYLVWRTVKPDWNAIFSLSLRRIFGSSANSGHISRSSPFFSPW